NPADPAWQMSGGNRWYVSMTTLPTGEIFILGGSNESLAINANATNNPTYEIWPKKPNAQAVYLQLMQDSLPNNLYPNVFSLPDGNIFIFANNKSIIYNVEEQRVVKQLPEIPGGPRSYPLTGSVVL